MKKCCFIEIKRLNNNYSQKYFIPLQNKQTQ